MKPVAEQNMSMSELNGSAARMGLTDTEMNVGGVSIPIIQGSWQKKIRKEDDAGGFVTTFNSFPVMAVILRPTFGLIF
jgi:hypothetical protein